MFYTLFLQKNKSKINAVVVCSNYNTALLCRYKSKTYKKLQNYNFIPKIFNKNEIKKSNFPVFVKKDTDQGARHAYLVTNKEELNLYAKDDDMLVLEYLPGDEVTVDCFTNKDRKLLFCNPRAADRILAGIDVHSRRITLTDEIKYIADSINKEIEFRGFWFFQIKKDKDGKFKLLEISTRLPGAFSLSRCLDVNLPYLALKDFDMQDVEISFNNIQIEADKQFFGKYNLDINYNKVYIDFETSFESLENVNAFLMLFLYQCTNKKIKLYLLVQNKENAVNFLNKNKISINLFDDIKDIKREKIKNILTENSILISNDDNLKNKIRKYNNKLYCFSNNIIESLIDWRA